MPAINHSYKPVWIGVLGEEHCGQCGSTDWIRHYWKFEEHNIVGNGEWGCTVPHENPPRDMTWNLRKELGKILKNVTSNK